MEQSLIKTGRVFYAVALTVFGFHQFFYADFRTVIMPPWPAWRVDSPGILAYISGAAWIVAAFAIVFSKRGKDVALVLGGILLVVALFWHLPFILFIQPNEIRHFGIWAEASKCLALAGGAFVVAGSFLHKRADDQMSPVTNFLAKLIPFGPVFFSITLIEFGIDHFLYIDNIATLVPKWIPGKVFWTYIAGAALIGSGLAIIFRVKVRMVAMLLGIMILLWFIFLHIPRAIAFPQLANGNEIVSSADALAFSGTAFIIAAVRRGFSFRSSDLTAA
jgi:uncharacterized membrane protein